MSDDTATCLLCYEPIQYYVGTPCAHSNQICSSCVLRMRRFPPKRKKTKTEEKIADHTDVNKCPFCKGDWSKLVFSPQPVKTFDLKSMSDSLYDKKLRVYHGTKATRSAHFKMNTIYCKECHAKDPSQRLVVFNSWTKLDHHLDKEHKLRICIACCESMKVLPHLQRYYTKKDLLTHFKEGTAAEGNQGPISPHPSCQFCEKPFFSSDELFAHLEDKHRGCRFCTQKYFKNDQELLYHYEKQHFLCDEPECRPLIRPHLHADFVVFRNQLDLQGHLLHFHHKSLSKAQRKDARRIDARFFIEPAPTQQHNDRRGGRRGGRGGRGRNNRRRDRDGVNFEDMTELERRSRAAQHVPRVEPDPEPEPELVQEVPSPEPAIPISASSEFPSLGSSRPSAPVAVVAPGRYGRVPTQSDEDFPALGGPRVPRGNNKKKPKRKPNSQSKQSVVPTNPTPSGATRPDVSPVLQQRNRAVVQKIKGLLKSESDFSVFKAQSGAFRHGEITAATYCKSLRDLLVNASAADIDHVVVELASLLPDPVKKAALLKEHNRVRKWNKFGSKEKQQLAKSSVSFPKDSQRKSSETSRPARPQPAPQPVHQSVVAPIAVKDPNDAPLSSGPAPTPVPAPAPGSFTAFADLPAFNPPAFADFPDLAAPPPQTHPPRPSNVHTNKKKNVKVKPFRVLDLPVIDDRLDGLRCQSQLKLWLCMLRQMYTLALSTARERFDTLDTEDARKFHPSNAKQQQITDVVRNQTAASLRTFVPLERIGLSRDSVEMLTNVSSIEDASALRDWATQAINMMNSHEVFVFLQYLHSALQYYTSEKFQALAPKDRSREPNDAEPLNRLAPKADVFTLGVSNGDSAPQGQGNKKRGKQKHKKKKQTLFKFG